MTTPTRPPFPVEGSLQEFLRNLQNLTSAEGTRKTIAAIEETVLLIEEQRATRAPSDTAWFMSSHTALKYYALKLSAARAHLDKLNGGPGVDSSGDAATPPGDLWLVTIQKCVTGIEGLPLTVLTDQHPAEFFAGLDRGNGKYALLTTSKVFPSKVALVLAAMQGQIVRHAL